ncbi:MAG: hypothetical protein ACE37H_13815 [Phycisphaeraceae bacterium]
MTSSRWSFLALSLILVATVGCKAGPRATKSNAITGTWAAVSAHPELEDELFSATLILDEDGYAFARLSEKDHEQNEAGERVAVEGESYFIQGKWAKMTDRRYQLRFEAQDGDEVIRVNAVGWRTGPDTMDVTILSPEDPFEAYVVGVERVKPLD